MLASSEATIKAQYQLSQRILQSQSSKDLEALFPKSSSKAIESEPIKKRPSKAKAKAKTGTSTSPSESVHEEIGEIFVNAGITALQIRNSLVEIVNAMGSSRISRNQLRFSAKIPLRFVSSTSVQFSGQKSNHYRDYWKLAAAALYEATLLLIYRPDLLKTYLGIVRQGLQEIFIKYAKPIKTVDTSTGLEVSTCTYEFPDALPMPLDFDMSAFNELQVPKYDFLYTAAQLKEQLDNELIGLIRYVSKLQCMRAPTDANHLDSNCLEALKNLISVCLLFYLLFYTSLIFIFVADSGKESLLDSQKSMCWQ